MKRLLTILSLLIMFGFGCVKNEPIGAELSTAILEKEIDGKVQEVKYTDDNTGEGLIIRAVDDEIMSFAGNIVVLFSVYNTGKDQNVNLAFSFGKDYDQSIYEYGGETTKEVLVSSAMEATVSTTAQKAVYKTITTTNWSELSKSDFNVKDVERKDILETITLQQNSTFIRSGETKFFKAVIKYIPTGREEFFIEAFGEDTYGHLDPWAYEQLFNTLNTADLNGQDSWSGSALFDVSESVKYEGAKGVSILPAVAWAIISRSITGVSAGNFYIASYQTQSHTHNFYMWEGSNDKMGVRLDYASNNVDLWDGGTGAWATIDTYTANTWSVFNIEFDDTNNPDQYRVRFHDGTSWGSFSTWRDVSTTGGAGYTSIDTISFEAYNRAGGGGNANGWDTITATDPTPAPASPFVKHNAEIILFE